MDVLAMDILVTDILAIGYVPSDILVTDILAMDKKFKGDVKCIECLLQILKVWPLGKIWISSLKSILVYISIIIFVPLHSKGLRKIIFGLKHFGVYFKSFLSHCILHKVEEKILVVPKKSGNPT